MELSLHISAALSRYKFFSNNLIEDFSLLPHRISNSHGAIIFRFRTRGSTASYGRTSLSFSKKPWIRQRVLERIIDEEENDEEDEKEDEEEASSSGDEASFLSLSDKLDRNMALLDDYEMEELGYPPNPNHPHGKRKALKLLATAARLDIEDFLQKKVYLEVEVKVKENWRQDEGLLKYYGYGGQIRAL